MTAQQQNTALEKWADEKSADPWTEYHFTESEDAMRVVKDAMNASERQKYIFELMTCFDSPYFATAAQQAEAACRALGLWEE